MHYEANHHGSKLTTILLQKLCTTPAHEGHDEYLNNMKTKYKIATSQKILRQIPILIFIVHETTIFA